MFELTNVQAEQLLKFLKILDIPLEYGLVHTLRDELDYWAEYGRPSWCENTDCKLRNVYKQWESRDIIDKALFYEMLKSGKCDNCKDFI